MLKAKSGYLTPNFFVLRTFDLFPALVDCGSWSIYHQSTKQDTARSVRQMYIASRWSAPGCFCVAVRDAGLLRLADVARAAVVLDYFRIVCSRAAALCVLVGGDSGLPGIPARRDSQELDHQEHYHDLGKWLLALTAFYTYVAFAQYFLIWYANIPEETILYRHRMRGKLAGGQPGYAVPALYHSVFDPAVPAGEAQPDDHRLDRGVEPGGRIHRSATGWSCRLYYKTGPQPHWLDLATLVTTVSICGLVFWSRFRRHKMVPVGDLRLEQSLHFENA